MATYRLWPATSGPGAATADTENYSLGVEFSVSSASEFTGWYWWARTAATITVSLYEVTSATTGTLVNQVTGVTIAAPLGEWKYIPVVLPTTLTIGTRYRAVVTSSTNNFYSSTANYWTSGAGSAGITNGILTGHNVSDTTGNDQGSFIIGASPAFPTSAFNGTNYWIDVEINDAATPQEGSLAFTMTRNVTIDGKRNPVGSLAMFMQRTFTCTGKRVAQGSLNFTMTRNVSITGGAVKAGSVSMSMTRIFTITGQHPADVLPPAPGNTRSDVEYNYQQFTTVGEPDPLTMLDYFKLNEPDQSKLNRPPE